MFPQQFYTQNQPFKKHIQVTGKSDNQTEHAKKKKIKYTGNSLCTNAWIWRIMAWI